VQRGTLAKISDFETVWSRRITAARSRQLLMIDKLAPKLLNKSDVNEVREIVRKEAYAVLETLSKAEFLDDDSSNEGDTDAKTKEDVKGIE
jgi:hypothetical protein